MVVEERDPPPERRESRGEPTEPAGPGQPSTAGAPAAGEPAPPSREPVESWETRFKYLFADFENFRRRMERERNQVAREGRARMLRQLLPVYEAALKAREVVQSLPARDPVRQGIELLNREWESFLRSEKVSTVARAGSPFRSDSMEAIAEAPVTGAHPRGSVVEVVQQGYLLEEDLLRPAKVVVARTPEVPAREEAPPVTGSADGPPSE